MSNNTKMAYRAFVVENLAKTGEQFDVDEDYNFDETPGAAPWFLEHAGEWYRVLGKKTDGDRTAFIVEHFVVSGIPAEDFEELFRDCF